MDIVKKLPDEVVDSKTSTVHTCSERYPLKACGQTYTFRRWQIPQEYRNVDKAIAERQTAFTLAEQAKAKSEWDELIELYRVSDTEWEAAQAQWRDWVSRRDTAGALDPGRFHTPPAKPVWQVCGFEGEERFSKVLSAQHEKCLSCGAMRNVKGDGTLSDEEKEERLARLKHDVPTLEVVAATGGPVLPQVSNEVGFEDLVGVSAWGHERATSIHTAPSSWMEGLRKALPKFDIIDLDPGAKYEFSDRKGERSATMTLLRNTDENALLGAMIANPTLSQRAKVFRQNRQLMEASINEVDYRQCLSTAEKHTYSMVAAEAWELKRDLLRLEKAQESLRARIEFAKTGCSVDKYNAKRCRDRRKDWADIGSHPIGKGNLGLHRTSPADGNREGGEMKEDEQDIAGRKGNVVAVDSSPTGVERIEQEHQQGQTSPNSPCQPGAVELNTIPKDSQPPRGLTKSPVQIGDDQLAKSTTPRDLLFNTTRSSYQHNGKIVYERSVCASTEGDSYEISGLKDSLPSTQEVIISGNETTAAESSKDKAKKDTKVDGLMEEDGISLKDFAAISEEKKMPGLRKLSIKNGSSSRPRWRKGP